MKDESRFTHLQYRSAKVIHLIGMDGEEHFYYNGDLISKKEADIITEKYLASKMTNISKQDKK